MRVQDAVLVARDVLKKLNHTCDKLPVSVTDVRQLVESDYGIATSLLKVDYADDSVFGMLLRYEDKRATIYVKESLNVCWTRFVTCKELAHLLVDQEAKHYTKNVEQLIQELMSRKLTVSDEMSSELTAWIAATEILIPWECRHVIDEMLKTGRTHKEIAIRYRVPAKVIDFRLNGKWRDLIEKAHADL